ncbi:LacI family DNA-binding transcriptional regulator [Micromonospora inositola]|uniref:LacI family DNA-binding transcriptional regulator n=1 Tax=Micromonospora inositola TaxID=47865 RepID=UPI00156179F3|nr:LacI family DNA-binding transcriptional regulator [Micromonospora inositola]
MSYVFNNGPRPVAAATRERVLQAAEELQYRPNVLARALSAGRTLSIGLVVPHIRNPYFAALAEQLEAATRQRDHLLLIGDAGGDADQERAHISSFIGRKVDGLILVSVRDQQALISLDTGGVPVVALHQMPPGSSASSLSISSVDAAREAAQHLVEHGYESIGVLTGPIGSPGTDEHLIGVRQAVAHAPHTRIEHRATPVSRYAARDLLRTWLGSQNRPRSVYCATDEQAFGVLNAAWEAGLAVPDDLAVMGGDGTQDCEVTVPPLTALRRPVADLASRAVELLLDRDPSEGPVHLTLEHDLVCRVSCGC